MEPPCISGLSLSTTGNAPTPKNSSSYSLTMPRSGYVHAARQPLNTTIMFSAVLLRRAPATWNCRIFAAPLNKQHHQPVHWLNHPNEPLSIIDTSRYSGDTQLLVQQALREQERIGWDKAFRGYLSLTWGLLEKTHDVPNPYNKNPQPSAWVISTLSKLGNFSKAMWKNRCMKLHDPNNTSSPTADLDAEIALCYANPQDLLAADRQLLHKPISKVLKSRRPAKTKFLLGIRRAHRRLIKERLERQYSIRHFFEPSIPTPAPIDPHRHVP
jgi:hypothetical protein